MIFGKDTSLSFFSFLPVATFDFVTPQTITLNEALYKIKRGERFDIEFVTCDRKRNTGGALKGLTNCIYPQTKQKAETTGEVSKESVTKAPRHYRNSTLNLQQLGNREITKVHIRLITKLNGVQVV